MILPERVLSDPALLGFTRLRGLAAYAVSGEGLPVRCPRGLSCLSVPSSSLWGLLNGSREVSESDSVCTGLLCRGGVR